MFNLTRLSIETTNRCQLQCIQCLHQNPKLYKGQTNSHPKEIDFQFFKYIVDQLRHLNPLQKHVTAGFQGEPLMYSKFTEAYEYIENSGMFSNMTTNAMLLTSDVSNFLINQSGFNNIAFSVDGATKETFEKIRVGANYERVMKNIDYFIKAAQDRTYPLYIAVNFVRMKDNEHEYEAFVRKWIDKGIHIFVSVCTDEVGLPQKMYWVPDERTPCRALEYFAIVLTNGDVICCCRDHLYQQVMGNLHRQTLKDVWEGEDYTYLRSLHERRLFHSNWIKENICSDCFTWVCDILGIEDQYRKWMMSENIMVKQFPFWEEFIKVEGEEDEVF